MVHLLARVRRPDARIDKALHVGEGLAPVLAASDDSHTARTYLLGTARVLAAAKIMIPAVFRCPAFIS